MGEKRKGKKRATISPSPGSIANAFDTLTTIPLPHPPPTTVTRRLPALTLYYLLTQMRSFGN